MGKGGSGGFSGRPLYNGPKTTFVTEKPTSINVVKGTRGLT